MGGEGQDQRDQLAMQERSGSNQAVHSSALQDTIKALKNVTYKEGAEDYVIDKTAGIEHWTDGLGYLVLGAFNQGSHGRQVARTSGSVNGCRYRHKRVIQNRKEKCVHCPNLHVEQIAEELLVCISRRGSKAVGERGTAWAVESVLSSAVINLAMSPYQ